jgi:hypothetical protein
MDYHHHHPASNGISHFAELDFRHRRQPSLACRLIARRFRLAAPTAALIAALAGFPLTAED